MNALLALAKKELLLLLRDKFALFWVLAFPLMFALFFGSLFGDDSDGSRAGIGLAVVDEDASEASRAFLVELGRNESLRLDRGEGDAAAPETISLEAARAAVQKGKRVAYLRVPSGFGENPYALFGAGGEDAARLEIGTDPGRRAEAGMLQGAVMQAAFGALQSRFSDPARLGADLEGARAELAAATDLEPRQRALLATLIDAADTFVEGFDFQGVRGGAGAGAALDPVRVVDVTRERSGEPRSAFDITFPQSLVWGLMSVAMAFAITLARERVAGTLLRLRTAPLGQAQLLGGKALACFVACLAVMVLMLSFGALALGVHVESFAKLAMAMSATAACFTGLMLSISVLGKTESAIAGASWGVMMPFAMIGGGMVPLMAMPSWLATASAVSPFRWAIQAVEGAVWRDFTWTEMALPCGVLAAIGAAFGCLGVWVLRRWDG